MPFHMTIDYLTGNLALVFVGTNATIHALPQPHYGLLLAIPVSYY